jgi:hypothetical protein
MAKRQRSSVAAAAKRRLAQKAATAAVEQYLGTTDPKIIAALLAGDPDFAAAMAEFQAALMLLKMPDDGRFQSQKRFAYALW